MESLKSTKAASAPNIEDELNVEVKYADKTMGLMAVLRVFREASADPITLRLFVKAPCSSQEEFEERIQGIDWK